MPVIFKKRFLAQTVFADFERHLSSAIDEIAAYFEETVLRAINDGQFPGIVGTGLVYKGGLKENLRREVDEPFYKVVTSDTPYSVALDKGTRPFRPPTDPLKEWFQTKIGLSESVSQRAAWALAEKFAKYGMEPRPFFTRSALHASSESVVKEILRKNGFV